MSIRVSMSYEIDANGPLPGYREAFERAVGHGFSKAVIIWNPEDALIIRRNENGEWPATYDEDGYTTCCGWHRDHRGHRMNCVLAVQLDASSQGVEL